MSWLMEETFVISQLKVIKGHINDWLRTGWWHEYSTVCLLYFKKYYKMIAIDLSKQEALDADPKAIR